MLTRGCLLACLLTVVVQADNTVPHPKTLLTWQSGGGWVTLTLDATGHAHYDFQPRGWGAQPNSDKHADLQLSTKTIQELHDVLKKNDVCHLKPKARPPVPEERDASLTVDLPDLRCTVRMLDGQWRESPRATACATALDQLANDVAKHGR